MDCEPWILFKRGLVLDFDVDIGCLARSYSSPPVNACAHYSPGVSF